MSHTAQIEQVNINVRPIARDQSNCTKNKVRWIERCIVKFKARRHAKKIMQSLNEAKQIHAGKRTGQTLDDFLKDF